LPRRVRQANLAPQLRQEPPEPLGSGAEPLSAPVSEAPERSPDEARALFSAFQAGARRGREEEETDLAHHRTGDKED
ncbi:hypothetical protein ACFQ08_39770, partial [Streptosporangium algeriense]